MRCTEDLTLKMEVQGGKAPKLTGAGEQKVS